MFLAALWKQVFINRIDKEDVASVYVNTHTHTHTMAYYSAIKKDEIMSFEATWMDLEIIILSEVRKKILYDITYMWNLKYDTNEHSYETETDSQIQRTDVVAKREGR